MATEPTAVISHPFTFRMLEVRRAVRLTPRMVRITLGGDDLDGFRSAAADDHLKVFFPHPGQEKPNLPTIGPDGKRLPADDPKPHSRDFTPRRYDPEQGELDIDFVIHGEGPASTWASAAKPGMALGVGGPRGSRLLANGYDWFLLAGDETALPAIGRRLEELPAGATALVYVEVAGASEEQELPTPANASITWLHRDGATPGTTALLEDAIRDATFPDGEGFAWVAGEALSLRAIRRHLLNERGLSRDAIRFHGHWKRGVANHDHHEPIEE